MHPGTRARVWNDNELPFLDNDFMGEKIEILPGKYREMEYDRAVDFAKKYHPPVIDGAGQHLPQGFKMIRVERITNQDVAGVSAQSPYHQCQACNEEFLTDDQLNKHIKAEHMEQWADKKEDVLKSMNEPAKKRPGRPAGAKNKPKVT